MCQKNQDFVYTVAEAWKHPVCFVVMIWENRYFIALLQLMNMHMNFCFNSITIVISLQQLSVLTELKYFICLYRGPR